MKWPTAPLDSLKSPNRYSFVGGPFGSELTTRDYVIEGVPVIRGNNLSGSGQFHDDDYVYVGEKKTKALQSNLASPGDLVFTQRGTLGQVGLIPSDAKFKKYVISQSQMKLTVDEYKANPLFLYYFFKMPSTIQQIVSRVSSSGVPHINLSVLKAFEVPVPDKDIQDSVVEFVRQYDDLIENNRRRIALLEQAARLLYEEWFVRFRFPGHEHTKIVNGLPVGWKRPQLGDYAPLQYGKALREDLRAEGEIPVYGSSGRVGTHNKPLVEEGGIIIGRKGTVGAVYFSVVPFWPIDTTYYIDNENVSRFLFYALQRLQFINTDVAVPGLNRDFAHSRELIVPTDPILSQYEEKVAPLFSMAKLLERQNTQLQVARDLLLPRLMSGEVEV